METIIVNFEQGKDSKKDMKKKGGFKPDKTKETLKSPVVLNIQETSKHISLLTGRNAKCLW